MKAMSKQELADSAGISRRTLMNWLRPHAALLERMGLQRNSKMLPPNVVKWICDRYCIDV